MDDYSEENYKELKHRLRMAMEANDAMIKDYERAKKKVKTLTYERNLLLDNIAQRENLADDNSSISSRDSLSNSGSETESDVEEGITLSLTSSKASHVKRSRSGTERKPTTVVSAPPKRSKASVVPVRVRRVQPIERDETGQPKLPQQVGVLTVIQLGTIISDRANFHNERYIFPVGYTVSRTYPSMIDPTKNTVVTSTIVDGGDGPRFHVVAEDMPDEPIIANSATGAWTVVVRRSNEIRQRDHSNSASGPDYYGFKHPTIAKMIQDLPGTEKLNTYVRQEFVEMEPRAAKGVMAAAEKKRGNLEHMGNANRKVAKEDDGGILEDDEEHSHITYSSTVGAFPQTLSQPISHTQSQPMPAQQMSPPSSSSSFSSHPGQSQDPTLSPVN